MDNVAKEYNFSSIIELVRNVLIILNEKNVFRQEH